MEKEARVFVAGHRGMMGQALVRELQQRGYLHLITRSRAELDLCDRQAVQSFFEQERPDYVFLSAARVGGIGDNSAHPVQFGYENSLIQLHVMESARLTGVKKLLFLASSCVYPRGCAQPMNEGQLMSGPLEPTNELYGMAKLLGIKMCQAYQEQYGLRFISCMPCNLYGQGDNYDPETGHVAAGMITKMHKAKLEKSPQVQLWGDGSPRREFLYVDDAARACIFLMHHWESPEPINVGSGNDISIADLANLVRSVVGYQGEITFNPERPNGMPRKLLDTQRINDLGWQPTLSLKEGLEKSYDIFLRSQKQQEKGMHLPPSDVHMG